MSTLALVRFRGRLPFWVDVHRWLADLGVSKPVRNLDATVLMIGVPLAAALTLGRGRLREALGLLGLAAPIGRAFVAAALFAAPMFVACAVAGNAPRLTVDLIPGVIVAPFTEEVFFRGLLCALLVLAAGWRFWPAALLGGLLFGLAHIPWTEPPTRSVWLVLVITTAGGAWYAWLLRRWRWNLWVPIFLHAWMNLSWMLFAVAENAVGGLFPNVGRGLTVALSIVATVRPSWFGLPLRWTARAADSSGTSSREQPTET